MLTLLVCSIGDKGSIQCYDSVTNMSRYHLKKSTILRKIKLPEGVSVKSVDAKGLAYDTAIQEGKQGLFSVRAIGTGILGSIVLVKEYLTKSKLLEYQKSMSQN